MRRQPHEWEERIWHMRRAGLDRESGSAIQDSRMEPGKEKR